MHARKPSPRARLSTIATVVTISILTSPASYAADPSPPLIIPSLPHAIAYAESHSAAFRALEAEERAVRAERSEARSLPNPELSLSSKQGSGETFGKNYEAELHVNMGGVVGTPWRLREADARARAALAHLEETRAARRFEVAQAWVHAVAARSMRDLEAAAASTWAAQAELTRRQRDAGTVNALDLAEIEALEAQARFAMRRAVRHADEARAVLAGLIGVHPDKLEVAAELPPPPRAELQRATWAAQARQDNPTLTAARAHAEAARRSLSTARVSILPRLTAGASYERSGSGETALSPELGLEIPLFNLGFARRARARADYEAATYRVAASQTELDAQLAALGAALFEARDAHAAWRDTVLPLRRRAAAEALRHYNFMLVGADRLLAVRRDELTAQHASIEALRDYWVARAALDRAMGAPSPRPPLPEAVGTTNGESHPPKNPSPSEVEEHRHQH